MTVLCHIDNERLLPSKQEVPSSSSNNNSNTQPHIVGHEDEHEEVAEYNLNDVQACLEAVQQAEHRWPAQTKRVIISTPIASERDFSPPIWTALTVFSVPITVEHCFSNSFANGHLVVREEIYEISFTVITFCKC
jgi:hypothetical protein